MRSRGELPRSAHARMMETAAETNPNQMRGPSPAVDSPPAGQPQPDKAVEWWFLQGRYAVDGARPCSFLLAFFRFNMANQGDPPSQGYMLLASTLEEGSDRHQSLSWIDGALMERAVSALSKPSPMLDDLYREAVWEELAGGRPPEPIERRETPVRFEHVPFSISWEDYSLAYCDDGQLEVGFREPGDGELLSVALRPATSYQDVLAGKGSPETAGTMGYTVCTKMELMGTSGSGLPVQGEGWLEHEWMESSWLRPGEDTEDAPLAWLWFGLSLGRAGDLLVHVIWNAKTGEKKFSHAMLHTPDGNRRDAQDIEVEPIRQWRSAATFISYPVEARIRIPSLEADLRFSPLADEQEFHVFQPSRALWEGAGRVEGTMGEEPVRGSARAEFHGYGHVLDYDRFLGDATQGVDEAIAAFLPERFTEETVVRFAGEPTWRHDVDGLTETIARPVWDLLHRKGKRWRPLYGHFLLRALGGDGALYDPLISVTSELLHSGALIIDDIEDESDIRRGEPCIHRVYGTDIAINAGTVLYFLPALALMAHPHLTPAQRLRLHEIKDKVSIEAHFGQALDLYWTRTLTLERLERWMEEGFEDRILEMYNLKTGAATRGISVAAAVLANADPSLEPDCVYSARNYAVAFQIVDDVHNFSRSPAWTKTAGEDIAAGKPTYVVVKALRLLQSNDRARLAAILCDPELRITAEGREEGMELVRASGALEVCRAEAMRLMDEGWAALAPRLAPSMPKILLRAMCRRLLQYMYEA